MPSFDLDDIDGLKEKLQKLDDLHGKFQQLTKESSKSRNTLCRILCHFASCFDCQFFLQLLKGTRYQQRGSRGVCGKIYDNDDLLFGENMQCQLIMRRNFGGRHFLIDPIPGRT